MKIIIVSHSGIGNLIHTTPCVKALVSMGHEVMICAWPRSAKILEGWDKAFVVRDHPANHTKDVDHVIVSPCGAIWQDEWTKGRVWRPGPTTTLWTRHEVDYYMDVARELGYEGDTPDPEVVTNCIGLQVKLKDFICISPGYLKTEHWPLKHAGNDLYSKLVEHLVQAGETVVFVGGSDDHADAEKIQHACSDTTGRIINLCGFSSDIRDTAAVLRKAKLVVGNDGGLMHASAAVGTKTVTIFTFTNPIKNRPYCNGEIVMVECEDRLGCQHGKWEKCGPRGCLNVPIEAVLEKINIQLASLNQSR